MPTLPTGLIKFIASGFELHQEVGWSVTSYSHHFTLQTEQGLCSVVGAPWCDWAALMYTDTGTTFPGQVPLTCPARLMGVVSIDATLLCRLKCRTYWMSAVFSIDYEQKMVIVEFF